MGTRTVAAVAGGTLATLLGVTMAGLGMYAYWRGNCSIPDEECLAIWTWLTYAGGFVAVVGVFSLLYGWVTHVFG